MGQAIEELCVLIESQRKLPAGQTTHYALETGLMDDAVREIRALQASRDRLFMEVQILQMTQGALKMEIDRLRTAPTIAATGAEMTISTDGSVTIKADCLSVSGDVVPA